MSVADGTNSCSNSNRFWPSWTANVVAPVRFPPGRLKLVTSPCSTGSLPVTNTIGIVEVAALAGSPVGVPVAAITLTCRRTRSAANAGRRSYWPSADRYSIFTFRPST